MKRNKEKSTTKKHLNLHLLFLKHVGMSLIYGLDSPSYCYRLKCFDESPFWAVSLDSDEYNIA